MHRVVAVQSLKFLEQRQQQSAFSTPPLTQPPQQQQTQQQTNSQTQPANNNSSDPLTALNSPAHLSSATSQPADATNTTDTIVSFKDYSSHLDERTAANGGTPTAGNAADGGAQHEKTITIIYHDKKDSNVLSTADTNNKPTAQHNKGNNSTNPTLTPSTSNKSHTSTLVIDELIRRKRDKLKKTPRGVWCSLGTPYVSKGEVDTEVGNVGGGKAGGGVRELTRGKRKGGAVAGASAASSGSGGEATRKVERLVELFRQSRVKMLQTSHEAIREREREREREKEREIQRRENRRSSITLLPSAAAAITLPTLDSADNNSLTTPRPNTANSTTSTTSPATHNTTHPTSHTHHTSLLPGGVSRLEYIARWRQAFDETKQALDRALIKRMVDRAEGRRRRMREGVTAREVEEMVTRGGKRGGGGSGGRRERSGGRGRRGVAVLEEEEKTQMSV